jgi:hypothetical protein
VDADDDIAADDALALGGKVAPSGLNQPLESGLGAEGVAGLLDQGRGFAF